MVIILLRQLAARVSNDYQRSGEFHKWVEFENESIDVKKCHRQFLPAQTYLFKSGAGLNLSP